MAEPITDLTLKQRKQALRQRMRALRDAAPQAGQRRKSAAIRARCHKLLVGANVHTVFTYLSTEFEVATHGLIDDLMAAGKTVLVPRIVRGRGMEMVAFPGWNAMRPAALGILSPAADLPAYAATPDCALLPGLAFCADGRRLGYGGGYYDRWLAQHHDCLAVALAYELQIVPDLPCDRYDLPVARIETEARSIRHTRPGSTA